jgi:hypothetical protein
MRAVNDLICAACDLIYTSRDRKADKVRTGDDRVIARTTLWEDATGSFGSEARVHQRQLLERLDGTRSRQDTAKSCLSMKLVARCWNTFATSTRRLPKFIALFDLADGPLLWTRTGTRSYGIHQTVSERTPLWRHGSNMPQTSICLVQWRTNSATPGFEWRQGKSFRCSIRATIRTLTAIVSSS